MGKKRRVINSPKFAGLRKHPKYRGLTETSSKFIENQQEVEEQEVIEETPVLKAAEETLNIEPSPAKPTPAPVLKPTKTAAKASAKKAVASKRPKTRRPPRKKISTQPP